LEEEKQRLTRLVDDCEKNRKIVEQVVQKRGRQYSFELARSVCKLRLSGTISLRKVEEVARTALECFIKNTDQFKDFKFPKKTTISRIDKAIFRVSRVVEEDFLQISGPKTLLFDGSEQFKFVNLLAMSVCTFDENKGESVMKLLDLAPQHSHKAQYQKNLIWNSVERIGLSFDKDIFFMCGDSAKTNVGVKNGIVALVAQDCDEVIPYMRCLMHVLNFCLNAAGDTWLPDSTFDRISMVVLKVNSDRYKNEKLLEEIAVVKKISLSGTPARTRICSYCSACRIIVYYHTELLEMVDDYIEEAQRSHASWEEWRKVRACLTDVNFLFDCNFLLDFYNVSFFQSSSSSKQQTKCLRKHNCEKNFLDSMTF